MFTYSLPSISNEVIQQRRSVDRGPGIGVWKRCEKDQHLIHNQRRLTVSPRVDGLSAIWNSTIVLPHLQHWSAIQWPLALPNGSCAEQIRAQYERPTPLAEMRRLRNL